MMKGFSGSQGAAETLKWAVPVLASDLFKKWGQTKQKISNGCRCAGTRPKHVWKPRGLPIQELAAWMSSGNIVRGLGQYKQNKHINKNTNCRYQSFSAVNGNEDAHLFKSWWIKKIIMNDAPLPRLVTITDSSQSSHKKYFYMMQPCISTTTSSNFRVTIFPNWSSCSWPSVGFV